MPMFEITNRKNVEKHELEFLDTLGAREWVVNHLDTSIEWYITAKAKVYDGELDVDEDEFEQHSDDDDDRDFDGDYSSHQRMWADRMDDANDAYSRGDIDDIRRQERRMGA